VVSLSELNNAIIRGAKKYATESNNIYIKLLLKKKLEIEFGYSNQISRKTTATNKTETIVLIESTKVLRLINYLL